MKHLTIAADYYQQALSLLPPDNVNDLAVMNTSLGTIYAEAGDLQQSLDYSQKGITLFESIGNLFEAGRHQRNIAITLANNGRLSDALLYARAALRNFETYQGRAKEMEDKAKGLIEEIEKAISGQPSAFSK